MNYQRIYNELITRGQLRNSVTPCEIHHILPRSMGGSDDSENLVALTPREHFIAHKLLWLIHRNYQMAAAYKWMSDMKQIHSGKEYEAARERVRKELHNKHGWLDNRLINIKTNQIAELSETFTINDFVNKYNVDPKAKPSRRRGNVCLLYTSPSPRDS